MWPYLNVTLSRQGERMEGDPTLLYPSKRRRRPGFSIRRTILALDYHFGKTTTTTTTTMRSLILCLPLILLLSSSKFQAQAQDEIQLVTGMETSNCKPMELDFIVNEGDATALAIEDDIVADLNRVGITVNTRKLQKDELNEAMVSGDFNLAFSETWGAPYDPQAFAASWSTPDEAYHAALEGLPEPNTKEVISQMVQDALVQETEAGRERAWTNILSAMHGQATELPFSGKRIPAVINRRLTGYIPGHQQFDYPAHTLKVLSGPSTVTVSPGAQTGLFSNETGVGRLDPHTYRPNEFFASNWVYDGLVEYGPGGTILPALAESWTVSDADAGAEGQTYTFKLRQNVTFHDGSEWNCDVAKLNFDHVLAPPLTGGDWHGW
jgi:nickel transport system substrate-binding protein